MSIPQQFWTRFQYLYADHFKLIVCGTVSNVLFVAVYTVYMWTNLDSLYVEQFKMCVCRPVYHTYMWITLQNVYV